MYIGSAKAIFEKTVGTDQGVDMTFYYRQPKPEEVHGYNNESVRRKGNKVQFRHSYAQLKYGAKILKGIKEGDFGVLGPDNKPVVVSSDPKSEFFAEDWKAQLLEHATTAVIAFGAAIFGGAEAFDEDTTPEGDDEEDIGQD